MSSTVEGLAKKLLYLGLYKISAIKGPNTYKIQTINTNKLQGEYNQAQIKPYYTKDNVQ